MKLLSLFTLCVLMVWAPLDAQRTLTGKVTDSRTGEALISVNVVLLDPFQGTVTDVNGSFSMELSESAFQDGTLRFKYLGYSDKELPISSQDRMDVGLDEQTELLNEVIVTAIGIKKETRAIGYSATEVKSDELQKSSEMNLMNSLNAKVAGVSVTSSSGNPGASTTVRIRGNKSIGGSNDPLYVIDGVPVDNSYRGSNFTDEANRLVDINPEDIESMTVLKGGAASALYGYRAANGAVIITTKRGKEGRTRIDFQSRTLFDVVNKLPEKQTRYGQGNGGESVAGAQTSWGDEISGEVYEPIDFFQTGVTSDNHLSISGGSKGSEFLVSLGHMRNSGIIPDSYFNRTSLKTTGSRTFNDKFKVDASVQISLSDANRTQRGSNLSGVMLGLMRAPVDYDLANGSDDPVNDASAWQNPDGSQRTYFENYDNPYWSVNKNRNEEQNVRLISLLNMTYDISDKVMLKNILSADIYSNDRRSYWDSRSNEFKADNGRIFNTSTNQRNLNNDLVLSYTDRLTEDLGISTLIGHNYFDYKTTSYEIEGFGFIIEDFYDFSNTNLINGFADDFIRRERGVGAYASVDLDYKNWLYLGLTGRQDWLSTLPNPEQGFFYPAVNLGAVLFENESNASKVLDYAKLRLSWANVGNGAPAPYITQDVFTGGGSVQGLATFGTSTLLGSPDLQPENTTTYEIGMDLRFLQGQLSLDATYYYGETQDPIVLVQLPASSGYLSTYVNGSDGITNRGVELMLNGTVLESDKRGLNWEASLNFTANRSEVGEVIEGIDVLPLPSAGLASTQSVAAVGEQYGVLVGSQWLRNESGDIIVDENGFPVRDSERGIVGDPNPTFTSGFRNDFSYKNWALSFLLDLRVGGDMFNGTRNVMRFHGTHIDTDNREEEVVWPGVFEDGTPNDIPIKLDEGFYSRYGLTYISEEGIEEVNWLRMRDLGITYSFNKETAKKIGASRLDIAIMTRNLFLITNYTGIDPETSLSGASNSFGRDYFNSPNTKSYGIRISASF